jgi:hypothetical protein
MSRLSPPPCVEQELGRLFRYKDSGAMTSLRLIFPFKSVLVHIVSFRCVPGPAACYRCRFVDLRLFRALEACPTKAGSCQRLGSRLQHTAYRVIWMAALKSRFTRSLRALILVERANASIGRTRAHSATSVSSSLRQRQTPFLVNFSFFFVFFFITCSASLNSRREEDFFDFLRRLVVTALQDPRPAYQYHSVGFFVSSNECTCLCP